MPDFVIVATGENFYILVIYCTSLNTFRHYKKKLNVDCSKAVHDIESAGCRKQVSRKTNHDQIDSCNFLSGREKPLFSRVATESVL